MCITNIKYCDIFKKDEKEIEIYKGDLLLWNACRLEWRQWTI